MMNDLTQEQVNELSDKELQARLIRYVIPNQADNFYEACINASEEDYLNNWSDLMTLVVERKIALFPQFDDDGYECWQAQSPELAANIWFDVVNKNPQRALAECLFLTLQEKANNERLK